MKPGFGIAIYRSGGGPRDEQEAVEVTHEEALALKAFDLLWFFANPAPGEFRIPMDKEKEFTRSLKQWRAGQ